MRNLKKVLTLVLTVAMLLSIMVVGTGAAFSDQSSIKNTEAVDACSTLNIIGGFPDGSYRPTNNVTRAEMCKMICVLLNGGKEPTLGNNTVSTFTDVRGTSGGWAESYIESCNSQGIVSGVGGGRFNPNGSVTGTQAARMLLVAMGFNADNEKFTGTSWDINVNIRATQKGLYKDIESIDTNAALSRDNAAQMIWNALDATMVTYKNEFSTDANGQIVAKPVLADKVNSNSDTISLLADKYETTTKEGILISVSHNSKGYIATIADGFATLDKSSGKPVITNDVTLSSLNFDPTEYVGKAVKAIYKTSHTDQVYGIYVDKEETALVVESTLGLVDKDSVKADTKVKVNSEEYKTDGNSSVLPVYTTLGSQLSTDKTLAAVVNTTTTADRVTMGSKIVFIDNDGDEKLDLAVVTPVTVAKVNYRGSDSFTLTLPEDTQNNPLVSSTIKDEDATITGDPAKGDYVSVIDKAYNAEDLYAIAKLDVINGSVKGTKSSSVMIDNTWYDRDHASTAFSVGNKVAIIALNDVLYGTTTADVEAVTNYLVLTTSPVNEYGDIKAKAILGDGSESIVTISKKWDDTNKKYVDVKNTSDVAVDTLYAYKVVDGKYQVIDVSTLATASVKTELGYDNIGTGMYTDKKMGGNPFDTSALVFVKDKDGYDVLTGSAVISWKDSVTAGDQDKNTTYIYDTQSGYNYIKVAIIGLKNTVENPGATSDSKYGYVVTDPYTSQLENGDAAMALDLFDGTDTTSVLDKNDTRSLRKGDIIEYTVSDAGTIKVKSILFTLDTDSNGKKYDDGTASGVNANVATYISAIAEANADKGYEDTIVKFGASAAGSNEFQITDETVILYINAKDTKGVTGGAVQRGNFDSAGNPTGDNNALYVSKTTNNGTANQYDLKLLVVDVNNNFDA